MTPSIAIPEPARQQPTVFGLQSAAAVAREPAHLEVARSHYRNLAVELDPVDRIYWCQMRPEGRPSFTPELLQDINDMQRSLQRLFASRADEAQTPFDYYVLASSVPGTYNLGGDLGLFADKIRAGDRTALRRYGHLCIEAIHRNAIAFDLPVVTIALVQGDALGGGFESALAHDMIVAERSAKMGLPEILFNLFPGMGAYSFLSRRLGVVAAERMIASGRIYSAEELHEMGVVDLLAEDGQGAETLRDHLAWHRRRRNALMSMYQVRRRVNPVTFQELQDVVEIWIDAALRLEEGDLRKMARLTAAQDRRRESAMPFAAE
ncbi:crotonase/enoyl-CoA hydratase family protein [Inquilinus limosus]|uniref:Enoyl-CoA hydratase n=1 Tax=Inquilinus limosus TaxID=171674 RepID=A0A211YYI3_9PROT|nr:crotonase/enoyl-CoA hydratase family protein [Inquilinus limosus]OWJ58069.1 enoyl-CoA hydratase [Inquilinus limosus]